METKMSISTGMAKEDMMRIYNGILLSHELPRWRNGKESAYQCRRHRRCRFDPWVRKILWRRKWQTTPVFLSGNFHGQRSLVGPWGCKESDMAEQWSTHSTRQEVKETQGLK